MKTTKIQHPTVGTFYQVTMSRCELLALVSIMRILKVGFINWLARKGQRQQETQYFHVRDAERIIDALEAPIVEERRQREAEEAEAVDAMEREHVRANDLPEEARAAND